MSRKKVPRVERLGGLEVDDHFELGGLLNGELAI